jgi:hypothetical protein
VGADVGEAESSADIPIRLNRDCSSDTELVLAWLFSFCHGLLSPELVLVFPIPKAGIDTPALPSLFTAA